MFKHPEDQARYIARWKEEHKDHIKQWHHNNYLNKALQRHGLTREEYEALEQLCEICGSPPGGRNPERLKFDHNHQTEKFRGLLCDNCNRGLGLFKDNAEFLKKASEYLERHS